MSATTEKPERTWTYIGMYFLSCLGYIVVLGIILAGVQSFHFHRQFYEQGKNY
jgi:hypothetical protein